MIILISWYIWSGRRISRSADLKWFAHGWAQPHRPVLPLCQGMPVAVIQGPHCWYTLLIQLLLLLPAHPSSTWGLSSSASWMYSTVAPSSPIWSPTSRRNILMSSSLASWLLIAVAASIWIYEVQPPSEHTSTLAVVQVHFQGILDGLCSPLPPLPFTLGLQSQNSNALQVDNNSPAHWVCPPWLPPICTNKQAERIMYLSHPIETVWQPNNVQFHMGIPTVIEPLALYIYAESTGLLRMPRRFIQCPRGSGESRLQNYNCLPPIAKHRQCMSSYRHISIPTRCRLISFCCLVEQNRIELALIAVSPEKYPIRSSNQVPKMIIENGNCKIHLLATSEHSVVIIVHILSWVTICKCCSTFLNCVRWLKYSLVRLP